MTRWEYTTVFGTTKKVLEELNSLGAEGWEAVNMAGNALSVVILLKRPVS